MTDGERMVWAAAFAQLTIAGHDFAAASARAYEVVRNLVCAATMPNEFPQTRMAKDVCEHHARRAP